MTQQASVDEVVASTPADPPSVSTDGGLPPAPAPMPFLLGTLYSLWVAMACDAVLELSLRGDPISPPGRGALASVLLMWCAVLFLVGLTGKLRVAMAVVLPLCMIVGAANWARMSILGSPIVPADIDFLKHPGFLVEMVDVRWVVLGASAAVAAGIGTLAVGRLLARRFARVTPGHERWRAWLLLRVLLVVLCGAALTQTATFNRPGNLWRSLYDSTGLTWASWGQVENYQTNGFLGGFLYNLPTDAMREPAGYGPDAMREIADRYARRAARFNDGVSADALGRLNIVLVLSESFADPSKLNGLTLDEDPIPRTRRAMQTEWGGNALAAFYGNGTSTMEFQALTGQADALFEPQLTTPYQQLVPGMPSYPTAVGWLNGLGYRTVAIHAYNTMLYHRDEVYSTFGFDDFVHDTTMREQDKIEASPFISDRAAYDEVVNQIEATESPVFAHLVTMQNHVPTSGWYHDPIGVHGVSDDQARSVGGYARGLSHTDADLPGFLESVRATKEPTVVVFFGDHFPAIFSNDMRAANDDLTWRTTPMFIWSDVDEQSRQLPVTNPISFLPLAMERVGAPLPPYYELLREVSLEVGALDRTGAIDAQGNRVAYSSLNHRQQLLLHDLRMVQYDFSLGDRYALSRMWYSPAD